MSAAARQRPRRARRTGRLAAALLALLWLVPAGAASDGRVLEIVSLRHALAEDVAPLLRELVSPGGTVTGEGGQLVLRTTPENLAELKAVLATLDRPLRQLRISVREDSGHAHDFREDALAARIESGDVAAGIAGPAGGAGLEIEAGGADGSVRYRHFATRGSEDERHAQFVTALEGRPAFIATGQQVPLAQRQLWGGPYGGAVLDSIDYVEVSRGFYVTPRVQGESVQLEIAPHGARLARDGGGVIDSRALTTTVSGRLGEWIPLGGAGQAGRVDRDHLALRTRGAREDHYAVWVKVDLVP